MSLVVNRSRHELDINGAFFCYTLENRDKLIAPGVWPLLLTPSGRAKAGTLWTPWPDYMLPLIVVPGREGIRIHAANREDQLEGCIALGLDWFEGQLGRSRDAIHQFKKAVTFPTHIEVK